MNIALLQQLGIDEKSAKIYMAALSLGTASVQKIAEKAQIKRPTTYLHIDSLLQKGFLEKVPIGKKEHYVAVDPSVLVTRSEQALKDIKLALPELHALKAAASGRPQLTVLEGEKGLKAIWDEIRNANSIRFWAKLSSIETFYGDYFYKIAESVKELQITTREIIDDSPESKKSSKIYRDVAGSTYSARTASKEGIVSDNAIYNNVAALFRIEGANLYVIRIEDPHIVGSMKALFDMAWEGAEKFIE